MEQRVCGSLLLELGCPLESLLFVLGELAVVRDARGPGHDAEVDYAGATLLSTLSPNREAAQKVKIQAIERLSNSGR